MLFERPDTGERAVLVHIDFSGHVEREDPGEFLLLVKSAGGEPVAFIRGQRPGPMARTFVGSGKLEEIRQAVVEHEAEVVLFNHSLSPSQERNLEKELQCRVLDRTGRILDICAQRARTHEGKLQVELAQLQYLLPRLVGRARAMGAALFADKIDARTAESWGMIWEAVEDGAFEDTWKARAQHLANGPTLAYGHIKSALQASPGNELDEQLTLEAKLQGKCGKSRDLQEGVVAFLEKRPATFEGR